MRDPNLLRGADRVCLSLLIQRGIQIDRGYDAEHDDQHCDGAIVTDAEWGVIGRLRRAAECHDANAPNRRKHLIVAAALLVAEIERIDRARKASAAVKEAARDE